MDSYKVIWWLWKWYERMPDGSLRRDAGAPDGMQRFKAMNDEEAIETARALVPVACSWVAIRGETGKIGGETWPLLPMKVRERSPVRPVFVTSAALALVAECEERKRFWGESPGVFVPTLAEASAAIRKGPDGLRELGLAYSPGLWDFITKGCLGRRWPAIRFIGGFGQISSGCLMAGGVGNLTRLMGHRRSWPRTMRKRPRPLVHSYPMPARGGS